MRKPLSLLAATAVVAGLGTQLSPAASQSSALQSPALPSPGSFGSRIDNPWFPLKPGTINVYRGSSDGQPARDVFTVTHKTKRSRGFGPPSSTTAST